jgi:uncharacterized protein YciI
VDCSQEAGTRKTLVMPVWMLQLAAVICSRQLSPCIMFIIDLHYVAPLDKIDEHMKEHVIFLKKYYKRNVFIASGRKVPRTGGIILALAKSRDDVDAIMQQDPFCIHNLVKFTVTEFLTSQYHPDLKKLLNSD